MSTVCARSSVGYTGGQAASPTYRTVCAGDGHTEAVRLVFDPKVLSYEEVCVGGGNAEMVAHGGCA
jgi:peptide methionine sulfoxide reductase MsrA